MMGKLTEELLAEDLLSEELLSEEITSAKKRKERRVRQHGQIKSTERNKRKKIQ